METYSSADDEITGTEDIIRAEDVKERTDRIKPWHVEDEHYTSIASFRNESEAHAWIITEAPADQREKLTVSEYDDEAAELNALHDLVSDFHDGSADPETAFAVNEDYMTSYAQEQGDSLAGIGEDSFLFPYVDWEQLGKDLRGDMFYTAYRGTTYYITN